MVTGSGVVVTLDGAVVDPLLPAVYADDPMLLRGDGVFETLLVRGGRPCLLEAHLTRLTRSATITGVPTPDPARWRSAVAAALARWPGDGDAVLRLVLGRGRPPAPTAFVTVSAVPDRAVVARRDGVAAVTLDRSSAGGDVAPWSLARVKSMSYAANAAALRHAERLGARDVVFVGADGGVLEGPRSTVVIATDDGTLLTPPTSLPILRGTTARALFDEAGERGFACRQERIEVADLVAAQGVWLLSSVTLAARVHTLDGVALRPAPRATEVSALVDAAIEREH